MSNVFWFLCVSFVINNSVNGQYGNDQKLFNQLSARSITNENFETVINEPSLGTLVIYSAPWCGHCKRMLPIWSELSQKHNSHEKFVIAKVDCTIDTELCSNEDILGYPTFVFYKKGEKLGHRYEDNELSNEAFELFMFEKSHDNANFDKMNKKKSVNKMVNVLDGKNFNQFVLKGFHFIKFYAPWCGHCKQMAQTWIELADSSEKVEISEVDCTRETDICQANGVRAYPTLLFYYNGKKVDSYKGMRNIEAFKEYMNSMIQKFEPEIKNTNENSDNTDTIRGHVLELTSENIASTLQKPGLLFVKFFAPWCGHCKNLAPTWIDLAHKYANVDKLIIAEIDCTTYQEICQRYNVNAYPMMFIFKDGLKLDNYEQGRDLDSFSEFINSHLVKYHEDL